jgi:lysophospholipid acyltransferase (LPLAT)-like uncharacterized protein
MGTTWRIDRSGMAEGDARLAAGERCIFALWHSQLLPLAYTHRERSVAFLISQHRDGELIAQLIERLGYVTARGSSTRGGGEGTREMISFAERGHLLGITPDGPRGPAEVVKPGLVFLASRTGFPVLPVAAAAAPAWRLRSWDGFMIPRPFARVLAAYGAPIAIPEGIVEGDLPKWQARIEQALRELGAALDARLAERS